MAKPKKSAQSVVKVTPIKLAATILIIIALTAAGVYLYLNWNAINESFKPPCTDDSMACFSKHLKDCSSDYMTINITQSNMNVMAIIKGKLNYTNANATQEVCQISLIPAPTSCTYYIPTDKVSLIPTTDGYTMLMYIISANVNKAC